MPNFEVTVEKIKSITSLEDEELKEFAKLAILPYAPHIAFYYDEQIDQSFGSLTGRDADDIFDMLVHANLCNDKDVNFDPVIRILDHQTRMLLVDLIPRDELVGYVHDLHEFCMEESNEIYPKDRDEVFNEALIIAYLKILMQNIGPDDQRSNSSAIAFVDSMFISKDGRSIHELEIMAAPLLTLFMTILTPEPKKVK